MTRFALTLFVLSLSTPIAAQSPPAKADARSAETLKKIRDAYRPTPVTRAVDRGLEYLRRTQADDGSWTSGNYGKNTGLVSLALMAFLARGAEPGRGQYGELLERGVAWIVASERSGILHRGASRDYAVMYSHGIAALLLGEVAGMVDEDRTEFQSLDRVHRRAVELILNAQNTPKSERDFGGWRYQLDSRDSDISVTGWQLLALRAAKECGLDVPKKSIDRAVSFIRRSALPAGGFRYTSFNDEATPGRTGTGILALQICGESNSEEARRGGDWLLSHPLRWNDEWFYYGAYYSCQAMYQLGGTYWSRWRPMAEEVLLAHQDEDGSWKLPPGTAQEAEAGRVYSTALAILALSVEFRYLPIYQR
ncbi:MAG: prenyltransferase/squalene oxidase repeat-containing protein [Planctomycetota bacterium]